MRANGFCMENISETHILGIRYIKILSIVGSETKYVNVDFNVLLTKTPITFLPRGIYLLLLT